MRKSLQLWCVAAALAVASPAWAGPLTLNALAANEAFQQTTNNPCVIGDNSCKQPANFPQTLIPAGGANGYDVFSPVYSVQQIRDVVGNTFSMGYDINQTNTIQTFSLFTMLVNGVVVDTLTLQPPQAVGPTPGGGNGNGYADYLIRGFTSLVSFAPNGTVQFHAVMPTANDGAEEWFLIAGSNPPPPPPPPPPNPVPEPMTLIMLGSGLVGIAARFRKSSKKVS